MNRCFKKGDERQMIPYVMLDEIMKESGRKTGYTLLDERHGCVNGSRCGISVYRNETYAAASSHEDQEGFFVLEGRGSALIGEEELFLAPGMAFMIPAHTPHAMRKAQDCESCRVFWFHAAV